MSAAQENSAPGMSLGGLASRALELRELRYFHSVARTGNFGRAARELNITQPSVTHQVQKLEEELGTQLLIRHGRGVTLTQAGSCLMDRIDLIMQLLSTPLEQAQAPEQTIGTVSLGLPAELAPLLVPPLIEQCRTLWPNVTLAIREGTSASLEEWVMDRRVDVALVQDPPALDELDIEPVVEERLGLVSGVRRPLLNADGPIRLRQLAGLLLLLPHPRHWIRRRVEQAAFRRWLVLDRVQQVDSVPLTKEMVRSGLGCTVLPYATVQDEIARGTLAFHPFGHDPLFTVHAIAWRKAAAPAPFIAGFRCFLRDAVTDLAKAGTWAGATVVGTAAKPAETSTACILEAAIE
jgi:LysR family nitrogen assimilation transcriptional regulator